MIVDQVIPPSVEDSHLTTEPVFPVKLIVPELSPLQTIALLLVDNEPAIVVGSTSIVLELFNTDAQPVVVFVMVINIMLEVVGNTVVVDLILTDPEPVPVADSELAEALLGAFTPYDNDQP